MKKILFRLWVIAIVAALLVGLNGNYDLAIKLCVIGGLFSFLSMLVRRKETSPWESAERTDLSKDIDKR